MKDLKNKASKISQQHSSCIQFLLKSHHSWSSRLFVAHCSQSKQRN